MKVIIEVDEPSPVPAHPSPRGGKTDPLLCQLDFPIALQCFVRSSTKHVISSGRFETPKTAALEPDADRFQRPVFATPLSSLLRSSRALLPPIISPRAAVFVDKKP